jgi:hypothetical protein
MENMQTETPHQLAQLAKCAHTGCICTVESGEQYCSDYCAAQAHAEKTAADDECNCGHPECAVTTAGHRLGSVGHAVS